MATTAANKNRAIRQDALREWLSEKCTAQHLVDNIDKIEQLDPDSDSFKNELDKYRVANDQRIKVLSKYLPDLKSTELTGSGEDGAILVDNEVTVRLIGADGNPVT